MARTEQREAMLRVLREHHIQFVGGSYYCACGEWPNATDESAVEHKADALLDAGCVMPDAMTNKEASRVAAARSGIGVRAALWAISAGETNG